MNPSYLKGFVQSEWREDRRHAPCKHRLATPRRTNEKHIVTACCRDLERPHDAQVTAHIGEIVLVRRSRQEDLVWIDCLTVGSPGSGQESLQLADPLYPHHVQTSYKGGFAHVCPWHHKAPRPGSPCRISDRKRAPDRPDQPVQAKLTTYRILIQFVGLDLATSCEQRRRQREVETGAGLAQVGWREIRRYPPEGKLEATIDDRGPDTFAGFLDGGIWQTNNGKGRQTCLDVSFDRDRRSIDADKRECGRSCQHAMKLRRITWTLLRSIRKSCSKRVPLDDHAIPTRCARSARTPLC